MATSCSQVAALPGKERVFLSAATVRVGRFEGAECAGPDRFGEAPSERRRELLNMAIASFSRRCTLMRARSLRRLACGLDRQAYGAVQLQLQAIGSWRARAARPRSLHDSASSSSARSSRKRVRY